MSLTTEECLKYEAECLDMAEDPKLADRRQELLKLAQLWRELAMERMPVES